MPDASRGAGNLPSELTSFVGRRRELAETRRLLATARLVTLTGAGGVGKTRLALRAAADVRRAFPDGVWFVPLAELRDPALLTHTIATTLGLTDEVGAQVSGLAEYLEDKRALLVLDNCEHVLDACAVLVAKLLSATSSVRVLATSRQLLRADGEQVLLVPPLPVPSAGEPAVGAVTLFAERAAAVVPGFTVDASNRDLVVRICRRLDGIPLALELAAVRLRVLSLEQILHRLDDRFRLLTDGSRTAPDRQQTLGAAIAWSFDLCSRPEQAVWSAVSVFAGGFDLEAAEAVCAGVGIGSDEVLDLVAGMVDKSILIRRNGTFGRAAWYGMLETVREYGHIKLAVSGREDGVRHRQVAYCARLARRYREESFGPRQLEWIDRLRREQPNIRVVLEYCLADPERAAGAAAIAVPLWDYWFAGGFPVEGYRWLKAALDADPERGTHRRGLALQAGAFTGIQMRDAAPVRAMLAELRELADELDDDALRAGWAQCAGMGTFYGGDLVHGRELLEQALSHYRAADDPRQMCNTLIVLASVLFFLDDPAGEAVAEEALALTDEHQVDWLKTYALWTVALQAWRQGDYRRSASLLRESLAMQRTDRSQVAFAVNALAWCASAAGRHERAAGLLGAARAVWRLSGSKIFETSPYVGFDESCRARSEEALGAEAFRTAFEAAAGLGPDEAIAFALAEKQPATTARVKRRAPLPGGLTRREREIAELVAEGLSNKQIAGRLVIAQRTAETHVENILTKLGFTSRAQIAAWLTEQRAAAEEGT
ncbi:LuxR family transcriptional regulator [Amycolatopsis endophytica]|uniref:Putative ATPase/DNA-binding CsgD family transcriptional regulator n=1 Tax=Amycolatopsis endophytica TaxID=860233 RepID=A0A853BBK9_9PSEU|nr:LuxR C-terminal-related transcriptional regulator [Amycolatopsis endophytica]NYI92773.1 putative ATPase/DNA-binding CsgD family transcriptional regulator [Amycolatopsis endophytica]